MEDIAIARNADLREQFYNAHRRGRNQEVDDADVPGHLFNYSLLTDTNSYFIHNSWQEAAHRSAGTFSSLLPAPAAIKFNESNEKIAEHRRMATRWPCWPRFTWLASNTRTPAA